MKREGQIWKRFGLISFPLSPFFSPFSPSFPPFLSTQFPFCNKLSVVVPKKRAKFGRGYALLVDYLCSSFLLLTYSLRPSLNSFFSFLSSPFPSPSPPHLSSSQFPSISFFSAQLSPFPVSLFSSIYLLPPLLNSSPFTNTLLSTPFSSLSISSSFYSAQLPPSLTPSLYLDPF